MRLERHHNHRQRSEQRQAVRIDATLDEVKQKTQENMRWVGVGVGVGGRGRAAEFHQIKLDCIFERFTSLPPSFSFSLCLSLSVWLLNNGIFVISATVGAGVGGGGGGQCGDEAENQKRNRMAIEMHNYLSSRRRNKPKRRRRGWALISRPASPPSPPPTPSLLFLGQLKTNCDSENVGKKFQRLSMSANCQCEAPLILLLQHPPRPLGPPTRSARLTTAERSAVLNPFLTLNRN